MITNEPYGAEPWSLTESSLNLDMIAQSESVFALSNGHIGLRGNLDEGEPNGLPGTYLNSVYEDRPLPYAEAGYGFPDTGQTVINITNGKIIRLLVDDEPFDIRYGTVREHTRTLDLRAGTLTRNVTWTSPAGHTVKVNSVRLVSLTQRAIAAFSYTVTPVDEPLRLVLMSELVANEDIPVAAGDPRAAAALAKPLVSEEHMAVDGGQAPGLPRAQHPLEPAPARGRDESRHPRPRAHGHPVRVVPRPRPSYDRRRGPGGRGTPHRQVRRLRLVGRAVQARPRRPGQRRHRGGPADRLAGAAR